MLYLLRVMSAECSCTIQCGCHRGRKLAPAQSGRYGFAAAMDHQRLKAFAL